jgi:hypothetical protein
LNGSVSPAAAVGGSRQPVWLKFIPGGFPNSLRIYSAFSRPQSSTLNQAALNATLLIGGWKEWPNIKLAKGATPTNKG